MESDQVKRPRRLMRVSEVEREVPPGSSLRIVTQWIREFLAQPHRDLGRKGSVCPFVPISLELDTIWMTEVTERNPSADSIAEIITEYRDVFLRTEPTELPDALQKSFLVVFPSLREDVEGAALVDKVQYNLKRYYVDMGLMLGEFHANNESPGLRNPQFRPLRCPVPMLAIRHMVESDLPFLARKSYPAYERSLFLRSYLLCLGSNLLPAKFDQALEALMGAESELWIAKMREGIAERTTRSFVLDSALNMILGVAP